MTIPGIIRRLDTAPGTVTVSPQATDSQYPPSLADIKKFLKVLINEKRGGLTLVTFDMSPFKLFSLRYSMYMYILPDIWDDGKDRLTIINLFSGQLPAIFGVSVKNQYRCLSSPRAWPWRSMQVSWIFSWSADAIPLFGNNYWFQMT
jgi:hypothetical protein